MLTLQYIVENPQLFTRNIALKDETVTFRPLQADDTDALTDFLQGLSAETRRLSTFPGYDAEIATELCDAIAIYDKLRFVIENQQHEIVGLLELSFAITAGDRERFQSYGIELNQETDCRFGPTLADAYQDKSLGSRSFPEVADIVRRFNRQRLILWGGVLADNARAIHFYQKHGFRVAGKFSQGGQTHLDMIARL